VVSITLPGGCHFSQYSSVNGRRKFKCVALKERRKENPVYKKAGTGAHPQEIQGK
jgi:hypothetical protein